MRAVERIAARARLPLRYSQGFNPHPVLSLALPRSVGVATRDDLLVIALEEPLAAEDLLRRMNENSPHGLRFFEAKTMETAAAPRPDSARYEMTLAAPEQDALAAKVHDLLAAPAWEIERLTSQGRRGGFTGRRMDLRPLVSELEARGGTLRMTLRRQGDTWARPGEVLALLGLDARVDLARLVRTGADYETPPAAPAPRPAADNRETSELDTLHAPGELQRGPDARDNPETGENPLAPRDLDTQQPENM